MTMLESTVLGCSGAGMGLWAPLGMLMGFGFWAVLVWGGVMLARRSGLFASSGRPEHTLADRYAAGDIDDDEYRRRLETLQRRPDGVSERV